MNRLRSLFLLWLWALPSLMGCGEEATSPPPPSHLYEAEIRYTAYGIPHIRASNLRGAGYGQGYALAKDHACTLVDQIVKVRGERARYFGPGLSNANVTSDFAYRVLDLTGLAADSVYRQSADVLELVTGFVTGFNRFLSEPEASGLPCAGQPWLAPINVVDLLAYNRSIALMTSSSRILDAIAAAQPPAVTARKWEPRESPVMEIPSALLGSNGWALGADRSAEGLGMLVANPHFPWEGEMRLWESQLTVPGRLDAYGASLVGVPGVLIGFNQDVAWTHTVSSTGARFTAYALKLVPGKPTTYLYDGQERQMSSQDITLQVLQPDGTLSSLTRTYYKSHYGPIISLSGLGWTGTLALTYRDANLYNEKLNSQFLGMNGAANLAAFQQVFSTEQGIPWVNTLATSREGDAWFVDGSATPNVSIATLQAWQAALAQSTSLQSVLLRSGIVLFDGSTPRDEWVAVPGTRSPGLIPAANAPQLARRDVVFNCNDSHWLAHPSVVLEGYSPLQGPERTARSVRTRISGMMLSEVSASGASGADGLFTLEELQNTILSDRSSTAELLLPAVVQRCLAHPSGTAQGHAVDLTQACAVLAAWNGRFDASEAGPALWREFIAGFGSSALTASGTLFSTPFSYTSPVTTPNTLKPAPATGADPVLDQLAAAVLMLQQAGISVNTPLGQVQFAPRAGQHIPLNGGLDQDGVANLVNYSPSLNTSTTEPPTPRGTVINSRTVLTSDGYVVNTGTSFLMALEFVDEGVRARAVLTYGQTGNTASPTFRDQLSLYSGKQWRDVAYTEDEIANNLVGQPIVLFED
ncbi:penicillin acylase family protein [Hyalangium versicolor]|uniref:penicillin acylase family protein n=1 Tax=Hyalangium versicolor TaxID=2861190 RepID=UPI001CCE9B31|nr:penicillin acylase family protein [Hyalangium versicolor]